MHFHFGWKKCAGLFAVSKGTERGGSWTLHFFVRRNCWIWGREEDWYDGPLVYFGAGPLFLFCWA